MAFTEADLTVVQNAILALVSGSRKVRFSVGDKSFEYAQADLKSLVALKQEIQSEVQPASARPRFFLTSTEKGL